MEFDEADRQYLVKGGKTILGKLFSYQEKTGMPIGSILKLPYILFVIGMLDAPSIDYESKKDKKDKITIPKTAEEELAVVMGILK